MWTNASSSRISLVSTLNLYNIHIIADFDENRFDLDEYEQRLKRFEDYLLKREDEQKQQLSQSSQININDGDGNGSMTLAVPMLSSHKKGQE